MIDPEAISNMAGKLEWFLVQMLVLFAGAQAITEAIKEKETFITRWFKLNLKKTSDNVDPNSQEEKKRQAQVRAVAWWAGTGLAFVAQINPLVIITGVPLWDTIEKILTKLLPAMGTQAADIIGALIGVPVSYIIVGYLAVYGAPMFNDLLKLVATTRQTAEKTRSALQNGFDEKTEAQLAQGIYQLKKPTITYQEALAEAQSIRKAVAAAAMEPPAK